MGYEGGGKNKNSEDLPPLFEDTEPYFGSSTFGKLFFTWLNPLVSYTNTHRTCRVKSLGSLPENKRTAFFTDKFRPFWEQKKAEALKSVNGDVQKLQEKKEFILIKAMWACYKWYYLAQIFWNAIDRCNWIL